MNMKAAFLEVLKKEHAEKMALFPAVNSFMKRAFDHFLEIGLPDKKTEGFSYFPFSKLYDLETEKEPDGTYVEPQISHLVLPECEHSYLVIRDGILDLQASDMTGLPKQVVVDRLEATHSPYMPFVHAKLLSKQKEEVDPFILLTQAHFNGALILIPEGLELQVPLQLIFIGSSQRAMATFNGYMYMGSKASCEMIITAHGPMHSRRSTYIDIELGDASKLELTRIPTGNGTLMMDAINVILKKSAQLHVMDIAQPEAPGRFKLHVTHEKEGALSRFFSLALNLPRKEYHLQTLFEHKVKNTGSYQFVKTALQNGSKASFEGQIYVHPEAIGTQSYQKHAALMLSEHALSYSRPNLRILADDVKASHGATLSTLDEGALFYLKTRGIDEVSAKKMLTEAFCLEVIEKIRLDSVRHIALEMLERIQDDTSSILS